MVGEEQDTGHLSMGQCVDRKKAELIVDAAGRRRAAR